MLQALPVPPLCHDPDDRRHGISSQTMTGDTGCHASGGAGVRLVNFIGGRISNQ
jgi:hypothetical protein